MHKEQRVEAWAQASVSNPELKDSEVRRILAEDVSSSLPGSWSHPSLIVSETTMQYPMHTEEGWKHFKDRFLLEIQARAKEIDPQWLSPAESLPKDTPVTDEEMVDAYAKMVVANMGEEARVIHKGLSGRVSITFSIY
jgi:hypothetical protein